MSSFDVRFSSWLVVGVLSAGMVTPVGVRATNTVESRFSSTSTVVATTTTLPTPAEPSTTVPADSTVPPSTTPTVVPAAIPVQPTPVAIEYENGHIYAFQVVERAWTRPLNQQGAAINWRYPVRVCVADECIIQRRTSLLQIGQDGSLVRRVELYFDDGVDMSKPRTVAFPIDETDLSRGFTSPSNPIVGAQNFDQAFAESVGLDPLEISYEILWPTGIQNIRVCANKVEGIPLVRYEWLLPKFGIDMKDYSGSWELKEDGRPFAHGAIGARAFLPCVARLPRNIGMSPFTDLRPGHVYRFSLSFVGQGLPELSGSLSFVTPGGCPANDQLLKDALTTSHLMPSSFAFTDADGVALANFLEPEHHSAAALSRAVSAGGIAPLYVDPSKTWVDLINPHIYGYAKYQYLRSLDDWAPVIDDAGLIPTKQILERTIFSGCDPSKVRVDVTPVPADGQSAKCDNVNNNVVPTAEGLCTVKVVVTDPKVTSSGIRRQSEPVSIMVSWRFNSLGQQSQKKTSSPAAVGLKINKMVSVSRLAKIAKLKVPKGSRLTAKIAARSTKYCRISRLSVRGLRRGTCVVSVTVRARSGKATTRSVMVKVTK